MAVSAAISRPCSAASAIIRPASRACSRSAGERDRARQGAASLPLTCTNRWERMSSRESPATRPSGMIRPFTRKLLRMMPPTRIPARSMAFCARSRAGLQEPGSASEGRETADLAPHSASPARTGTHEPPRAREAASHAAHAADALGRFSEYIGRRRRSCTGSHGSRIGVVGEWGGSGAATLIAESGVWFRRRRVARWSSGVLSRA